MTVPPALLLYLGTFFNNGTTTSFIMANLFYEGTSLPQSVFGELLSIPAVSTSLAPLSYFEVANYIVDLPQTQGHLFGASALDGSAEQPYLDAYAHYLEFTESVKTSPSVESALIAFTPVLASQIQAGRLKGRNAIDPPLTPYHAVQFEVNFSPGIQTVPQDVEAARQLWFTQ